MAHTPNPTDQSGTLDTSESGGPVNSRIEGVTGVFQVAEKDNLVQAGRALDPKDDAVRADQVILPDDPDEKVEAEKNIKAAAKKAADSKAPEKAPEKAESGKAKADAKADSKS